MQSALYAAIYGKCKHWSLPNTLLKTTVIRHLRPIAGVNLKMSFQCSRADEPHEAESTAKRSFSRVNSHVPFQRRRLRELLVTENTVVRPVTCKSVRKQSVTSHSTNNCLSNAIHGIGQILKSLECMSVCVSVRTNLSSTIATAIFVQSSSNLVQGSHM